MWFDSCLRALKFGTVEAQKDIAEDIKFFGHQQGEHEDSAVSTQDLVTA